MRNTNRRYALLLLLLLTLFSCKKYIQQQEQNALVSLVTNGTWRVSVYTDYQSINLTDSFTNYIFQFNENGTVYGTRDGVQTNGTWTADVNAKTITSVFPTAGFPLVLLNYTWKITDSKVDWVAAKTPVDTSFNILNLQKN